MRNLNAAFFVCFLALGPTAQFAGAACDSAYVSHKGSTWTVFPTGADDADNLGCAFDEAVAAGSGSVVKMVAGEYLLLRPIAVLYEGDLTWKGAGKNRTVITAGSDDALFPLLVNEDFFPEPGTPSVIVFHQDADGWVGPGGNELKSRLRFKGFTIRLRGVSEPWEDSYGTVSQSRTILDVTGRIDGLRNFETSRVRLEVTGVRLQGETCGDGLCGLLDWTAHSGLLVRGEAVTTFDEEGVELIEYSKPLTADTVIATCAFDRIGFAAGHSDAMNSDIKVSGNRFTDVGAAYFLQDADGGKVEVRHNRLNDIAYYGVIATHGLTAVFGYDLDPVPERFPTTQTAFELAKNTIRCTGEYSEGVVIEDYTVFELPDGEKMLVADVAGNTIRLAEPAYAAVGSFYSRGVRVVGNTITGRGAVGIYAQDAQGWTIRGNTMSMGSGLPIWLGESVTDSFIEGNHIRGRGGDAAVQIDGDRNRASKNSVTRYRPDVAHFWLTATSEQNELEVAEGDSVQDDGSDNTVTVESAPAP